LLAPALAAEWPQWRGPHSDGSVAGPARNTPLPDQPWILWKRQIGGASIWSQSYLARFEQDESALFHGLGPYATPALSEGRLLTFGVNSVLTAWDAANGELLWRRNSADEFDPAFPYFGAAASPVVWEDLIFVHLGGHDRRDIEDPAQGAMVALRVADGREMWRWTGDGPAVGATPVVAETGGRSQIVFKTKKMMVGADARTGRELWRIPYNVSQDNTIVTPIFSDGRLITSDFDRGVEAWRIQAVGSQWTIRQLWKNRDVSMSMSTPVLAGELVVGLSHLRRGQLFLLEPETGEVVWQGSPRIGEHASLVSWGDEVLVFLDNGSLSIGRVENRRFRELERYRLGEAVGWSHPAVVGAHIIYRDGEDLTVGLLEQK
jgi:outer membrane protein assembly factor BamB